DRTRLAEEALDDVGIVRQVRAQHLDGGAPPDGVVDRLVDDAHASVADLADQPVVTEGTTYVIVAVGGHGSRSYLKVGGRTEFAVATACARLQAEEQL